MLVFDVVLHTTKYFGIMADGRANVQLAKKLLVCLPASSPGDLGRHCPTGMTISCHVVCHELGLCFLRGEQ